MKELGNVLIIEDHPLIADGYRHFLNSNFEYSQHKIFTVTKYNLAEEFIIKRAEKIDFAIFDWYIGDQYAHHFTVETLIIKLRTLTNIVKLL